MTHLILGDGVAGMSAAEVLRKQRGSDRILVVSEDPAPYYFRASLTNYLMGELSDPELWALPPDGWAQLKAERVQGRALRVDGSRQQVHLDGDRVLHYDRLLIATGARARRLPSNLPGVGVLRSLSDTKNLLAALPSTRRAIVVGGGILGLELAYGLLARNVKVTLLHRQAHLMERVLDRRAAELVQGRLQRAGVELLLNAAVRTIEGTDKGVSGVVLEDGRRLPCQLLVAAIGNEPNTEFLADSGIRTQNGYIVTDRTMAVTGLSNVYAAGDVAMVLDPSLPFKNPAGLWQPARKQGQAAGLNMAGRHALEGSAEYRPGVLYNATRAWDLDLGTLGEIPKEDEGATLIGFEDRVDGKPIYKRAILRNGHVTGALLLGDRREGTALRHLMNLDPNGAAGDVTAIADRLFDPSFDLPGWVDLQRRSPGVRRLDQTLRVPRGPLAPSLAARAGDGTQLKLSLVDAPQSATALLRTQAPPRLELLVRGQTRSFEGDTVRIGRNAGCDLRPLDPAMGTAEAILRREGIVWMLSVQGQSRAPVLHNGSPLQKPVALADRDLVQAGDLKAVVRLPQAASTPAASPMQAGGWLIGLERFALRGGATTIGSAPDNDIVLRQPGVSAFHAQILRSGALGQLYLTDFASEGGTFVNHERIQLPRLLEPGDQLRFGPSASLVYQPGAQPEPEKKRAASPPQAFLVCIEGPLAGRALGLTPGTMLGRDATADLVLDDPLLSRLHARFERKNGAWSVVDEGSVNGTLLEDEKLGPGPAPLVEGSRLRLGRNRFRFQTSEPQERLLELQQPGAAVAAVAAPTEVFRRPTANLQAILRLQAADGALGDPIALTGPGPFLLGREGADCAAMFRFPKVSRRHAEIRKTEAGFEIVDLGSKFGTSVDGRAVQGQPVDLEHGAILRLGDIDVVLELQEAENQPAGIQAAGPPEASSAQRSKRWERTPPTKDEARALASGKASGAKDEAPALAFRKVSGNAGEPASERVPAAAFRIDWAGVSDPLQGQFQKLVESELDSCIGCHDCMRACPLPDAKLVGIGALNSAVSGHPLTEIALRFVQDCTQCQACVPVCPADIHRSKLVLWNKLKLIPAAQERLTFQVGDQAVPSDWTLERLSRHLEAHPMLSVLGWDERLRLLGQGRYRRLLPGEVLLEAGRFVDVLWIVLEGRLEVGMPTDRQPFQRMVLLAAGQTAAEVATLSDQPSDVTVRAVEPATLVGLPKYSVKAMMKAVPAFQQAVNALYLARSVETYFKKHPDFAAVDDEALSDLIAELQAERYAAGQKILEAEDADRFLFLVRRGFVAEWREDAGRRIVSNYLKEGEAFGLAGDQRDRRGRLLHYQAGTQAEVLSLGRRGLEALARQHASLKAALLRLEQRRAQTQGGATVFSRAAELGVLQATRLLVIDTRVCVDCNNCEDACARRHGVSRLERGGIQVGPFQVPASCYHCNDPVCLLCAVDGIVRDPSGEIRIIPEACIGCGACAERCPYDNIQMTPRQDRRTWLQRVLPNPLLEWLGQLEDPLDRPQSEKVAVKCDLCVGYKDGPACVRSCPVDAAMRVDPLAFFTQAP